MSKASNLPDVFVCFNKSAIVRLYARIEKDSWHVHNWNGNYWSFDDNVGDATAIESFYDALEVYSKVFKEETK